MSRLRSGFVFVLLVAGAVGWPPLVAAQAVTGTISGTITDTQGQVIPGATVTVINEATNESRVRDQRCEGRFSGHQSAARQVHGPGRARRASARSSARTSSSAPASGWRSATSCSTVGSIGETVVGRSHGHARQHGRDAAQRPDHRDADRTGAGARPRRDLDHAAAAWRPLREHRRLARHELRHRRCRTSAARAATGATSSSTASSRNEVGAQRPDGAADQPRRDRRGARAAEFLPRRVRARRRRTGADRQQERDVEPTTAISTTTAATRRSTPTTSSTTAPSLKKPRYRFNTFGANLGGPVPKQSDKKLFFFYSLEAPLVSRPGPAAQLDDADRSRDAGRLLADARRAGPPDLHQGSAGAAARATPSTGGPRVLPGQHHPGRTASTRTARRCSNMLPRANNFDRDVHAGTVQLHDAGERREPEDEQRRPRRLEADDARQLLLHVQGLVLGPARQRDHRRPEQVGLLQHALPEHRSRRQRELREDPPLERWCSTRDFGITAADRAVLSVDGGGLDADQPRHDRLHASASSIRS